MFWFGKRRAKRISRKELNPAAAQKTPLQPQETTAQPQEIMKQPQETAPQTAALTRMQAETEALLTLLFTEQEDLPADPALQVSEAGAADADPAPMAEPAATAAQAEVEPAEATAEPAEPADTPQIAVSDSEIAPSAEEAGREIAAEEASAAETAERPAEEAAAQPAELDPAAQPEAAEENADPAAQVETEPAEAEPAAEIAEAPEAPEAPTEASETAEASAEAPEPPEAAAADTPEIDEISETPAPPAAPSQLAAALGSVFGTGQEEEARERLKRRDRRIRIFWRTVLGSAAALVLAAVGAAVWAVQDGWRLVVVREEGEMVFSGFSDDHALDAMLELSGLALNRGDQPDIRAEGLIVELSINRAFPVTVTADGVTRELFLTEEVRTVEQLLAMAEVTVGEEDILSHTIYDVPYSGMELVVQRVTRQEVTETVAIPAEAVVKQSPLLRVGRTLELLTDEKRDGEKRQTYLETYIDGELQSRELLREEVLREPVSSILLTGANVPASSINGARYTDVTIVNNAPTSYTQLIESEPCTAYSFDPGVWGASGMYLYQGFVAVDPDRIPLGSLLYITSPDGSFVYGWAIAADVCEAAVEGRVAVDCFFETYRESQLFGRHTMNIYVVEQLTQADLAEYIAREGYFVKRIPA